jgi:ParB family chromosome partitioning protein
MADVPVQRELIQCPIELIDRGKNPRSEIDPHELELLAKSVADFGVIDPIIVTRTTNSRYLLWAGERRWRAAQKAGLRAIPAFVFDSFDAVRQAHEQGQRSNWSELDWAKHIAAIMKDESLTQLQAADRLGKSQTYVSLALSLLKLPESVQDLVRTGQLAPSVAQVIATKPQSEQVQLARQAIEKGLKTRDVRRRETKKSANVRDLEQKFQRKLGMRVEVLPGKKHGTGEVRFRYGTMVELDRLIEVVL